MGAFIDKGTTTYLNGASGNQEPIPIDATGRRGFHIHGDFSTLDIDIQGSVFGEVWKNIETDITAAALVTSFGLWPVYRIVINTLTGGDVIIDWVAERMT